MLATWGAQIALLAQTGCALNDCLLNDVVSPALWAASVIAPGAIALSLLHKLQDHQISGGGFLVDMTVRAGGVFLSIQVVRAIVGA